MFLTPFNVTHANIYNSEKSHENENRALRYQKSCRSTMAFISTFLNANHISQRSVTISLRNGCLQANSLDVYEMAVFFIYAIF